MSRIFLIAALFTIIAQGVPATTIVPATTPAQAPSPSPAARAAATPSPVAHATPSPAPSGRELIARMYHRYAGHWYHTFTFDETHQTYQNGSLDATQTCYQFIRYPDQSRIDFGDVYNGNASIFRGDSSYDFTHGKRTSAIVTPSNGDVFLLGGMFFYPLDRVYAKIQGLHYDLTTCRLDHWQGRPTFVIGSDGGNQLWIDSERLYIVRLLTTNMGTLDARYDGYTPFGGGWSATKCSYYFGGTLIQVDTYHRCKADVPLDKSLFDPAKLVRSH